VAVLKPFLEMALVSVATLQLALVNLHRALAVK
jgi:hypothetical protein